MSGSAAEWVESFYQAYPQNPAKDPDYGTKHKVVRGGGFTAEINLARTTYRDHQPADEKAGMIRTAGASGEHNTNIGFRCAISANDPKLREYLRTKSSPKK
jgi:formylglycine-generating enzyme required for sulfatase activity